MKRTFPTLVAALVSAVGLLPDSAGGATISLGTTGNARNWLITGAGATAAPAFQTSANHAGEISLTSTAFRAGAFVPGGTLAAFNGFWFADETFTLPASARGVTLTFTNLYGNDRAVLQLNGTIIGDAQYHGATGPALMSFPPGPPDVAYTITGTTSGAVTTGFVPGVNTLRLIVNNTGVEPIAAPTATFASSGDATDAFLTATVTYYVSGLNGSDDFNDNSKDPARWGVDVTAGVGLLTETNGRLEFTTSGASTSLDLAAWPWVLNFGCYTQNWEIHIDVSVPQPALPETRFGLMIAPGTNLTDNSFRLDLVQTPDDRYFAANLDIDKNKAGVGDKTTASASAALRIAFDASTKVLSAFYDEDGPACGYSWTLLGSTNVPAEWNMTSATVFGVWVYAYTAASLASTNHVFGDNFYASSGPTPPLGISLADGKAVLAWSSDAPSCQIEFASTLTPPICWQAITNVPGMAGTNFILTNPLSGNKGFYRLSR